MGIPISGRSTAQVAKLIGVSKNTLLRWLKAGLLPKPKRNRIGKINWRVWTSEDIERARKIKGTLLPGPESKKKS